jgi:hypothetical protein
MGFCLPTLSFFAFPFSFLSHSFPLPSTPPLLHLSPSLSNKKQSYANQVRMVLKALLKKAEESVCSHFSDILDETPMTENSLHVQLHDYIDMGKVTTTELPASCLAELTSESFRRRFRLKRP